MAQQSTQQVEIVTNDIFSFADLSHDLERKKKYHSIDDYISLSKCNQGIKLFSYAFKLCLSSYQAVRRVILVIVFVILVTYRKYK